MRSASWPLALSLLAACGGSPTLPDAGGVDGGAHDAAQADAGPPRDWPESAPPALTEPEPGLLREVLVLEGFDAPPNPTTMDDTPADLDRMSILRVRAAGVATPRAIVLAMPGFLGGAGSFEMLARHVVRRSVEAGSPVEVWAIDRRSNLLEDRRGLDAAEASGDAEVARGYYQRGETLAGRAFAGFLGQEDVPAMSEWGLRTQVGDVQAILSHVPASLRRGHVFLLGHSLGGSFAETFAAWRFEDGSHGVDQLAGLILVDGAQGETPLTEAEYRGGSGMGLMMQPGLDEIRSSRRFFEIPLLGVGIYAQAEMVALDALRAPDEVREDRARDRVLSTLLSLPLARVPSMSNAAAFGLAFDDASNGLSFAAVSCGTHAGGAVESYDSLFGVPLVHPSEPAATYTWIDAAAASPPEQTPLANLAHAWVDGRTNFAEWYFPARLPVDLAAVAGLAVAEGSYQQAEGLTVDGGATMDAPVLAIAAGLRPVEGYAESRARGAALGPGRRGEGLPRTDDRAYRVLDATFMTHIDPLTAADSDRNPVPSSVVDFILQNVEDGTVTPTFP